MAKVLQRFCSDLCTYQALLHAYSTCCKVPSCCSDHPSRLHAVTAWHSHTSDLSCPLEACSSCTAHCTCALVSLIQYATSVINSAGHAQVVKGGAWAG